MRRLSGDAAGALILLLLGVAAGAAQVRAASVSGRVSDVLGAPIAGARVEVRREFGDTTGHADTGADGRFALRHLPHARYELTVSAAGFATATRLITLAANVPVTVDVVLDVAPLDERVLVDAAGGRSPAVSTPFERETMARAPAARPSRAVADLVALAPGVTVQNNGLLHVRGTEDGILYVLDGLPMPDRIDALHASGFDVRAVDGIEVFGGHLPSEFGGRNAAVVEVRTVSPLDERAGAAVTVGAGAEDARDASAMVRARVPDRAGFMAGVSGTRSARYLDPPDERNFHNEGRRAGLALRGEWRRSERDSVTVTGLVNGATLEVPNDTEQERAGQAQLQRLHDRTWAAGWQRTWASSTLDVLASRQYRRARLAGSPQDVPLTASADREHGRTGVLASVSRLARGHVIEAGVAAERVTVSESFGFAITDAALARERSVSEEALAFTPAAPFAFRAAASGWSLSGYVQDSFVPMAPLTVSLGLRVDRAPLPTPSMHASPRAAVAWAIGRRGTVLRAHADRLVMPPQLENLLLANSEEARALSPFADDVGGGAAVRPERTWSYEVGASQPLGTRVQVDAAQWWRRTRDAGDPNVFFNTTVVFPNSVARGTAYGTDATVAFRDPSGWSGRASYTYARVEHVGPITGGLFLTDEFAEIGPGTRFTPDHDQRHTASALIGYAAPASRWWVSAAVRHQGGVPLEVDDEALDQIAAGPGAEFVDLDEGRIKPWTLVDATWGLRLVDGGRTDLTVRLDVQNLANRAFAYNVGNPFEGTHLGHGRLWRVGFAIRY